MLYLAKKISADPMFRHNMSACRCSFKLHNIYKDKCGYTYSVLAVNYMKVTYRICAGAIR